MAIDVPRLSFCFYFFVAVSRAIKDVPYPPRLLDSLSISSGESQSYVFHLFDEDPIPQTASFCRQASISDEDCSSLSAQANNIFFSHQWKLNSKSYLIRDESNKESESSQVEFDLYTNISPLLQAERFCVKHKISAESCRPLAEDAREMFYDSGVLLGNVPLQISYGKNVESSSSDIHSLILSIFDNLSPDIQAREFCQLHQISSDNCEEVINLARNLFYPHLTSIRLTDLGIHAEGTEVLDLFHRQDPIHAALQLCRTHSITTPDCEILVSESEKMYFAAFYGGYYQLIRHYEFPGTFEYSCRLYSHWDPIQQAQRCCRINNITAVICQSIESSVQKLFEESLNDRLVASFSLQRTGIREKQGMFNLHSHLDPFIQLSAFCKTEQISYGECFKSIDIVVTTYYEYFGPRFTQMMLANISRPFNLYLGSDPSRQVQLFCDLEHIADYQCQALKAHSMELLLHEETPLSRYSIDSVEEHLVLFDILDPEYQVNFFCNKHGLNVTECGEIQIAALEQFYHRGNLINVIPMSYQNNTHHLYLYHNVDPERLVNAFCKMHRISLDDCSPLKRHASDMFFEAGNIIDTLHLYFPNASDNSIVEKDLRCYDNLDPEIQARKWCNHLSLDEPACSSVIEAFEKVYFQVGDVIERSDVASKLFTLYEDMDPFEQAKRFCRRNRVSLRLCAPLIEWSEKRYYKLGELITSYEFANEEGDAGISFHLHDKVDPKLQVDRFCSRHSIPPTRCSELQEIAVSDFLKVGNGLGTIKFNANKNNTSFDAANFTLQSNLDPLVQAQGVCEEYDLSEDTCVTLVDACERLYFRAGDPITNFTYAREGWRNISFVLYDQMDPQVQLKRFFKRHQIPMRDRANIVETMTKEFFAAGSVVATIDVSIDGYERPVPFKVYDNLDPFLQTSQFCHTHDLLDQVCDDIVAAAEQAFFGHPVVSHFVFSSNDKTYRYNILKDVEPSSQIDRFCFVHDFSVRQCALLTSLVDEQMAQADTDVEVTPDDDGDIEWIV